MFLVKPAQQQPYEADWHPSFLRKHSGKKTKLNPLSCFSILANSLDEDKNTLNM